MKECNKKGFVSKKNAHIVCQIAAPCDCEYVLLDIDCHVPKNREEFEKLSALIERRWNAYAKGV